VIIVSACAVAGIIITLVAGTDPGGGLATLLLIGSAAAALAVRQRHAYLFVPVPALAYLICALIAGMIHDRSVDTSHTVTALNAGAWLGNGFYWMTLATIVVIIIAVARWLRARRTGAALEDRQWDGPENEYRPVPVGVGSSAPILPPAPARPAGSYPPPGAADEEEPGYPDGFAHFYDRNAKPPESGGRTTSTWTYRDEDA
jgi:hypothetical protein